MSAKQIKDAELGDEQYIKPIICIKTYARKGWSARPGKETFFWLFSLPWTELKINLH